jgi:hypothetical protein
LLLCDSNGGAEGFLSGGGVRRIAVHENLTADAVGLRFEPALPSPLGVCNSAVHSCKRGFDLAGVQFRFCQRRLENWSVQKTALLPKYSDAAAHTFDVDILTVRTCPAFKYISPINPEPHSVVAREAA